MEGNDLIGKIVLSKAGRDKNHLYILIRQLTPDYVLVANGITKTVNMPKKKKIKHLVIFDDMDVEVKTAIINNDKSTDLKIKKFLKLKGIVKEG